MAVSRICLLVLSDGRVSNYMQYPKCRFKLGPWRYVHLTPLVHFRVYCRPAVREGPGGYMFRIVIVGMGDRDLGRRVQGDFDRALQPGSDLP